MTPRRVPAVGAFLLLTLAVAACASAERGDRIEPDGLDAALAEGRLLLDVRTAEEYAEGHIPGATRIPVRELGARLDEIGAWHERGIVAYCESGGRATRAARMLRDAGFDDVVVLDGSMQRWRAEGRRVATGAGDAAGH